MNFDGKGKIELNESCEGTFHTWKELNGLYMKAYIKNCKALQKFKCQDTLNLFCIKTGGVSRMANSTFQMTYHVPESG